MANDNSIIVPIDKVKTWDKNDDLRIVKREDFQRLKNQINRYGIYKPLIVYADGNGGFVTLGGNSRLRAVQELGHKEVWISIVSPKNEAEKLEINLSDNDRIANYNESILSEFVWNEKDSLNLNDFKFDSSDPESLTDLLDSIAPTKETFSEDQPIKPLIDKIKVREGDIFTVGKHKVMCADCTKEENIQL